MKLKNVLQIIHKSYFHQSSNPRYGVEWLVEQNDGCTVIAFRGSRFKGACWYCDTLRNILALIPWYNPNIGWSSLGYITGALTAIKDIEHYLKLNKLTNNRIVLGGHSLGAALSFLTGLLLHNKGYYVDAWVGVGTVNCMLSNKNSHGFNCFNYKYEEDIVSTYPPRWLGFIPPIEPTQLGGSDNSRTSLLSIGDFKDHKLINYINFAPDIDINNN